MLTQCPNCQTTFRVTTEILRVADGQVRCGRCQTQFDALERLIDENEAAEVPQGRAARGARTPPAAASRIEVEEPTAQEDITLEGRHIEISGRYRLPDGVRGEPRIREETVEEWVEIDDIEDAAQEPEVIEVDEDLVGEQPLDELAEAAVAEDSPAIEVIEEEAPEPEPEPEIDLLPARQRTAVPQVWKILAGPLVLLEALPISATAYSKPFGNTI